MPSFSKEMLLSSSSKETLLSSSSSSKEVLLSSSSSSKEVLLPSSSSKEAFLSISSKEAFPSKRRERYHRLFNSERWNDFQFRDDDIVVASYAKSGTTWTQNILFQLVMGGKSDIDLANSSPWLDSRHFPKEKVFRTLEEQKHRRVIKTHLPADSIVYNRKVKYVFVARDGRDVAWSSYNHLKNISDAQLQKLNFDPNLGQLIPKIGKITQAEFFRNWLDNDCEPYWSMWDMVSTWWEYRNLPNVLVLHYNNLKNDLEGNIKKIASFLNIELGDESLGRVLKYSSFEHMQQNAQFYAPKVCKNWENGPQAFFSKGKNKCWEGNYTEEDVLKYEKIAAKRLGNNVAHWLQT
eukprot:CAMPEP_0171471274 /NCGR_PEP_ID=MMETSP0946-20130122/609_1 /TAXON_ID=109269 /ORGANISM="Vaucheria litorea, Strain CCMP2940" /LENGTH=349 /DNA_ID=CAMNT_0012000737 /DNA_START=153 /DNA_END=1198 /DNA_ORIENTATION=-